MLTLSMPPNTRDILLLHVSEEEPALKFRESRARQKDLPARLTTFLSISFHTTTHSYQSAAYALQFRQKS
jgi:hypothetical protein